MHVVGFSEHESSEFQLLSDQHLSVTRRQQLLLDTPLAFPILYSDQCSTGDNIGMI